MNVGQVEAGIKLDGAESALAAAKNLENSLNGMDKKTYTAKVKVAMGKLNKEILSTERNLNNLPNKFYDNLRDNSKKYSKDLHATTRQTIIEDNAQLKSRKRFITESTRQLKAYQNERIAMRKKELADDNKFIAEYANGSLQGQFATLRKIPRKSLQEIGNILKERGRKGNLAEAFSPDNFNRSRTLSANATNLRKVARVYSTRLAKQIEDVNQAFYKQGGYVRRLSDVTGQYNRTLNATRRTTQSYQKLGLKNGRMRGVSPYASYISGQKEYLQALKDEKKSLNVEKQIADGRTATADALKASAFDFSKTQQKIQTGLVQTGSQLQTLGNTLSRVTAPFTRLFSGALLGAGFAAVNKVTEGFSNAFSRYDIIETYEKRLGQLGLDATKKFAIGNGEAMKAIDNLDESVRGLPTGLDEMVDSMSRYAGAMGSVEKATKLAIAANNAFIAGQMDDRQKLFTERQLLSLAGGAELASTQWDSLRRNAPMAIRTVAKEMKKSVGEMMTELKKGSISGQEFLDTFIKVGTEGRLQSAAQKMKMTWNSVSQNISNAFSRMGYKVLTTLDEVFEKATGRNLLQDVLGVDKNGNTIVDKNGNPVGGIKKYIDDISESVQGWIKQNPDAILDFWQRLKDFDIAGTLRGFIKEVAPYAKMIGGLLSSLGGEGVGKWLGRATLLSKGFTIVGGALKGLAKPLSMLGASGVGLFKGAKIGIFGKLFGALGKMGKGIKVAAFGALAKAFTKMRVLTKADTFRKLANNGKHLKGATVAVKSMDKLQGSIIGLANKAINIAGIMAFAKSMQWIADALQTVSKTDISVEKVGGFALAAGALITEFAGIAQLLGAKGVVTGIAQFSRLLGTLEIAAIAKTIQEIAKAMNDVSNAEIPDGAKLHRVTQAMADIADAMPKEDLFSSLGKIFGGKAASAGAKALIDVTKAVKNIDKLKVNMEKISKKIGDPKDKAGANSLVGVMKTTTKLFKGGLGDVIKSMFKSWESSNVSSLFSSMASITSDFKQVAGTKINEKTITKATNNMKAIGKSLKPLLATFKGMYEEEWSGYGDLGKGIAEKRGQKAAKQATSSTFAAQAGGFVTMMDNFAKLLDNTATTFTNLARVQKKIDRLKELFPHVEGGGFDFSQVTTALSNLMSGFAEVGNAEDFTSARTGIENLSNIEFEGIDKAMTGVETMLRSFIRFNRLLTENNIVYDNDNPENSPFAIAGSLIGQLMDSLVLIDDKMSELGDGDIGAFTEKMGALKKIMTPLKTVFSSMMEMQTMINETMSGQGGATGGATLPNMSVQGYITDLMGALTTMNNTFTELGDLGKFQGNMAILNNVMTQLRSIFVKLTAINTMITESAPQGGATGGAPVIGGGLGTIGTTIKDIVRDVSIAAMQAPALMENAATLQLAFGSIKTAFDSLTSIADTAQTAANTITTALATLSGIGAQVVTISITIIGHVDDGGLPAKIRKVAQDINSALDTIKSSYTKPVSVKIIGNVSDGGVPGRIRAIGDAIRSAFASIPTTLTKFVSVNIHGSVTRTGQFDAKGGLIRANGNPIYRKMGGFAFQPKGTDTVPAMLTPGEYVVRKRAVDTFGARFLQRINHLDVRGALNALSAKAGKASLPQGSTIINNKTINHTNKPNITINNPTGNGGVGLVQASRWAHSF